MEGSERNAACKASRSEPHALLAAMLVGGQHAGSIRMVRIGAVVAARCRTPVTVCGRSAAVQVQIAMHKRHAHRAFAYRRCDALDRRMAHVPRSEYARHAGLQMQLSAL